MTEIVDHEQPVTIALTEQAFAEGQVTIQKVMPPTAAHSSTITITVGMNNIGQIPGTFRVEIHHSGTKVAATPDIEIYANLGVLRTLATTTPSTGTSVTYAVKLFQIMNGVPTIADEKTVVVPLTEPASTVTCANSCDLLLEYDTNKDGIIGMAEVFIAADALEAGVITPAESIFINDAYVAGSINERCRGCYTGAGPAPPPPPPPPESDGDPSTVAHQYSLEEGEYAITVTKRDYTTVEARITVGAGGSVTCNSVTGGSCDGSGYPRVETVTSSVRVYMAYGGGTPPVAGGVCDWITSLGGWKSITWKNVLAVKYAYRDPVNYSVGFSPVTWSDFLGVKYYYYGISKNDPSNGNNKLGCGFT